VIVIPRPSAEGSPYARSVVPVEIPRCARDDMLGMTRSG
jgi:hypothetical protein